MSELDRRSTAPRRPYSSTRRLWPLRAAGLAALLTGCGGSGGIDEPTFQQGLRERDGITEAQARCVTDYVFAAYDSEEITVLHEVGLRGLSSPRWLEYGHAMVGCLFQDPPASGP